MKRIILAEKDRNVRIVSLLSYICVAVICLQGCSNKNYATYKITHRSNSTSSSTYAHELDYIAKRRVAAGVDYNQEKTGENLLGMAFSGGGIRSATFNLGVLQALENENELKNIDYLSTVSGGGYIGAWYVGHLLNSNKEDVFDEKGILTFTSDPKKLLLNANNSSDSGWKDADPVMHLRAHSRFMLDNTYLGVAKPLGGWALRFIPNLVFDVTLAYKPTRGKFNMHHPFYIYSKQIRKSYVRGYPDGAGKYKDILLTEINPDGNQAPYLIMNASLKNGFGVVPFEFTSDYCGAEGIGFVPSEAFDKAVSKVSFNEEGFSNEVVVSKKAWPILPKTKEFPLVSAVTASGGAVDSAALKHGMFVEPFTKFLNINLRYQTRNYSQNCSRWYQWPIDRFREMTLDRFYTTKRSNTLKISDGGHYDNLGVVALVKRQVTQIVMFDASEDGKYEYSCLENTIKKLEKEGYCWDFDETSKVVYNNSRNRSIPPESPVLKARIKKAGAVEGNGYTAEVFYCKASYDCNSISGCPDYINNYAKIKNKYPHISTFKQWFGWSKFEAYRQLGYMIGKQYVQLSKNGNQEL